MLVFIGLGLNKKGLSLEGLEEAMEADRHYCELYTSLIPRLDVGELEDKIGNSITILERRDVEQKPEEILETAKEKKVVFFVPGDPMVATTHVDLRIRAAEFGVKTKIVHASSIETAASGLVGLQSYKFGRTTTLPFPDKPSDAPYEVLSQNAEFGLHTMILLDIDAETERYLKTNSALEQLLKLENRLKKGVFTRDTLSVVVARAGSSNSVVKADLVRNLLDMDFGPPPHVLIVPGELHFLEEEALKRFADTPEEVL